jgi:hypothetical protein
MNAPGKAKPHPIKITEATYKDVRSVVLESDFLRVEVIPESGAKMASLLHKRTGVEHLYQRPGEKFRSVGYADPFEKGEAAGFDEMFPTISACYCDVHPWAGALMPDHGEVWSIPWRFEVKEAAVRFWVHGVRFPYVLSKTISFESANTIHLQYCAENPSPFAFPAMWAAHPLFNASPGSRIILPESVRNIVNTVPGPALGAYGGRFNFPVAMTPDGRDWDLSRLGPNDGKYFFKYFCLDELKEGFALIHDPETRETTAMCWPVDQLPYLGMWVNEGAWEGQFNVAPEPCTAPFDRWDVARQWGRLPVVPALGSLVWELRLTVDLADNPRRVLPHGAIE